MEQLTAEEFLLLLKQLRVDALHNAMIETDPRRLRLHLLKTVRTLLRRPCALAIFCLLTHNCSERLLQKATASSV